MRTKLLLAAVAILLCVGVAQAEVTVNQTKDIDGTKQWVMITLTVDGDTCRYTTVQPWNTDTPVLENAALATWVNSREDRYTLNILKGMYPGARPERVEGNTLLEDALAWIAAGHTNAAYCKRATGATEQECQDNRGTWIPETVIDKVPWVDSWSASKVQAEKDMKTSILAGKTNAQIQTYITNNVTTLAEARMYLYRLTKEVRNIIKRNGWE